ncbi:MAG: glycerol kinase GlpK [Acidobacteria bacterium]|nr:glycerol kinase GlpK [Acidobacteriota bacterium]
MANYLGALDQGTTSTRFIVFDRAGHIVAQAQKEHEQIYPQQGWVEHNPLEIWHRTIEVIEEACAAAQITSGDIASIGIANQRETTVVWDRKTGTPVTNAIVWQDTRVGDSVSRLTAAGAEPLVRALTGLPLATYFSALKVRWILDHVSGARDRAENGELLFGTIDTFLLWHLTGGVRGGLHRTDVSNASRTQLMNLDTLAWDDQLLMLFDIPRCLLPEIHSSSCDMGTIAVTSLKGTGIGGMLGDQHAALVGQTCFAPGQLKNTYGTGCFLVMNTGTEKVVSRNGLLTTIAYRFGDEPVHYALEGSVAIAGALVQWLRDNLAVITSAPEIEHLASSVEDNGGVYIVPAFSGLYAPYWKQNARGIVAGLTRFANRGHLARAALEAVAYQTLDVVEAMEADAKMSFDQLRVDGGMVGNELLMQFQADILNRSVLRPAMQQTTALGAAYAAGLSSGFYQNLAELKANWSIDRTWQPSLHEARRIQLHNQWKKAVTRSFDWVDEES